MKKLTVKDIAKKAGVSVTAVSFVLNNKSGVSDATRKRVQKIINETDFKPSLSSKKLVLNKSFNICLMMNAFSSPFEDLFYFEITRGIINRSMKCNYNVIISKPILSQTELPDLIYSGDADGIIFMQDISPALIEKANLCGVPFLVVDSHSSNDKVTSINPDYKKAAYDATSYLIRHGHTDIAIIASNVVADFYNQTLSGFTEAMTEHNITPNPSFCNISATVSNIIAWIFSVIVAFLTNKPLVFRSYNWSKEVLYPEFLRFVICRLGTLLIESAIMLLLVDILRLNGNVTKLVVSILVVVGNFIASKYIVFRYKSK